MTVQEGIDLIAAKIESERPTLREYLRSRASTEAKSHREWEKESPGCGQSAYRAGSSNAYLDIERRIEKGEFKNDIKETTQL